MSSQTLPHVEVPDTSNPLSNESYLRLQSIVEPSGKDLYRCAVQMVGKMMQQQDSNNKTATTKRDVNNNLLTLFFYFTFLASFGVPET